MLDQHNFLRSSLVSYPFSDPLCILCLSVCLSVSASFSLFLSVCLCMSLSLILTLMLFVHRIWWSHCLCVQQPECTQRCGPNANPNWGAPSAKTELKASKMIKLEYDMTLEAVRRLAFICLCHRLCLFLPNAPSGGTSLRRQVRVWTV